MGLLIHVTYLREPNDCLVSRDLRRYVKEREERGEGQNDRKISRDMNDPNIIPFSLPLFLYFRALFLQMYYIIKIADKRLSNSILFLYLIVFLSIFKK